MKKGDIILVPFPFSDLTSSKKRPALVLVSGKIDITLAFITTKLKWKEETDIEVKPTRDNGLKKISLIRLSKLATIDKELAIGRIGTLNNKTIEKVNKKIIQIFKLD